MSDDSDIDLDDLDLDAFAESGHMSYIAPESEDLPGFTGIDLGSVGGSVSDDDSELDFGADSSSSSSSDGAGSGSDGAGSDTASDDSVLPPKKTQGLAGLGWSATKERMRTGSLTGRNEVVSGGIGFPKSVKTSGVHETNVDDEVLQLEMQNQKSPMEEWGMSGGGDSDDYRDDDLDSQGSGGYYPGHVAASSSGTKHHPSSKKYRSKSDTENGTTMPEKQPSGARSWFSCCSKKSVAVASGKTVRADLSNDIVAKRFFDNIIDKDSFFRRPKSIFSLLTMLAISFGISYAFIAFQWGERSIGVTVLQGPSPLHLTLVDDCTVTFIHNPLHNGTTHVEWESRNPTATTAESMIFSQSTIQIAFGDGMITSLMINASGVESTVRIPDQMNIGDVDRPGPLAVEGDALHFDANHVTASTVNIAVEEGFVRLNSVMVEPGTRSEPSLIVTGGTTDIVVSPARSLYSIANLAWSSPCAYVCLPSGHYVDDSQCVVGNDGGGGGGGSTDEDLGGSGDETDDFIGGRDQSDTTATDNNFKAEVKFNDPSIRSCRARHCDGYYAGIRLGPTSNYTNTAPKFDPQSSASSNTSASSSPYEGGGGGVVEIELRSDGGTVYLVDELQETNMLQDELLVVDNLVEYRLNGQTVDVMFDEVLAAAITPDPNVDSAAASEDTMVRIELPGFLENSYFLYSSNEVYAKIKPGLLAILSGGLLSPKLTTEKGRLFPGFCPGPMAESPPFLKGQLSDLLKKQLELETTAALVEVRETASSSTFTSVRYDLIDYVKTVELMGRSIGIKYEQTELVHSTYVTAVIIVSLVMATAIGLGLAFVFFGVYKSLVKGFLDSRILCDRVYSLYVEVSRPQDSAVAQEDGTPEIVEDTTKLVSKTKKRIQRLSAMKADRNRKKESAIYRVLQLKESYYQFGKLVLKTIKNSQRDSLKEFTEIFMQKNMSVLLVDGVWHVEFSEEYEVYCTKQKIQIQNLNSLETENKLQQLGLYKETMVGAKTEVFIRLRFRAANDKRPIPENLTPGETSLDVFIDCELELTPFDTDCIPVSEFRRAYMLFIEKNQDLVEVPVMPRGMRRFSSELVRKKLTFYLAVPRDSDAFDRKNTAMYDTVAAVLAFVFTGPHMNVLGTVLLHMVSTLLLPFPILMVTLFSQHEIAKFALPKEEIFAKDGIFQGPLPNTFKYETPEGLEWQNAMFIAMVVLFYLLGWIELVQFYIFELGVENNNNNNAHETTFSSKFAYGFRMAYICLIRLPFHCLAVMFVVSTLSYFGLGLCWCLLSAVINPYKFLPYANAAGMVVYVAVSRQTKLSKLTSTATKRIHAQIDNKNKRLLEQRKQGYNSIGGWGRTVDGGGGGGSGSGHDLTDAEGGERYLDRTSKAEFYKLLESTGIDRSSVNIYGLANGTNAAVNMIAAQLGVEPTIAMIIVSLAMKSNEQLLDAAQELGPKLGLDGALARSLMNLANSWNKESGRQGIKLFINTVSNTTSNRDVFFNLDPATTPFAGKEDTAIDSTMAIMPEVAASMLAITEDSDFEPLVELLNTEKVVRDAFKPVPMQLFALMQEFFEADRIGVRRSLIRLLERLLISDACKLKMKSSAKPIRISSFVEHLSHKFNTDCQLAAVLAKIAAMPPDTAASVGGLQPRVPRGASTAGILGPKERAMIKVLKGAWKPLDRDEIRRPVQSTKRWLRSKIVNEDEKLILASDGTMSQETQNFVLVYQVLCLFDGIASIWMQTPEDLKSCEHFCREILSLEPEIAGAILALINAEEGGVNPASVTDSKMSMKDRILNPLAKQLSIDVGVNSVLDIKVKKKESIATSPVLMEAQINKVLAASFSLTRGRRIEFTKLAILSGLNRETAQFVGCLLNGKLKAPLWKQVTPLCNALGLHDSSCIIALMQLRRQADVNDFQISTDALLPWLGVTQTAQIALFRWLIQLALAFKPAHIQIAIVSAFEFNLEAEARKYSYIVARRRRLNVRLGGNDDSHAIWYSDASIKPTSRRKCMDRDVETVAAELKDSELNTMNEWVADQSNIGMLCDDPKALRLLTRHYESVDKEEALGLDVTVVKRDFCELVTELYHEDADEVDPGLTGKVFDFITFFLTSGEDVASLKAMALAFKVKPDLLKTLMQVPLYSAADLPVRTLERPRAAKRIEQAIVLLKDHLRIPAEIAFKYDEMLCRASEDIKFNDDALFDICKQLDRHKERSAPRCWEFVQALTLPANAAFDEFTSRVLYVMLNLERDVADAGDFLENAKLMDRVDIDLKFPSPGARNKKWSTVRQALRGLIAMCTSSTSQTTAFLHAADWIHPCRGSGLMLKLAISATSGTLPPSLGEHLDMASDEDHAGHVLLDLTHALTGHALNKRERDDYALAFEAVSVLTTFRRSGDPQGALMKIFRRTLRNTSQCLEIHPAFITAMLSATTGDVPTYDDALLQLAQDDGGLTPQVAGGLCSIGSGDVKGIEELATELDMDPNYCEGLVALASGTATTTRGCLPGFLSSLEIEVDLGLGLLGLMHDDSTSIAKLADALSEDRPLMREKVFNTLVCLPGLRSTDKKRIVAALDGLSSNSKLNIRNQAEIADVALLINTNTYAVRDAFDMLKLDLDLTCLAATIVKWSTVPFSTCDESYESPAHMWRQHMPGNYVKNPYSGAVHASNQFELGAEAMFASLCSSKMPKLFQRITSAFGMSDSLPESKLRSYHEKMAASHIARPWNLQQTGHFLTAIFYTGITGRFTRILEALDMNYERIFTLKELLEDNRGYAQIIDDLGEDDEILALLDPSHNTAKRRTSKGYGGADGDRAFTRKAAAQLLLKAIMAIPPQLINSNPHKKGSDQHAAYRTLQQYLRTKLIFDAKCALKGVLIIYRLGAMNMSAPPIASRHNSKTTVELTLRWAKFDHLKKIYEVERPTRGTERAKTFMTNVDWDLCRSSATASNWEAFWLLLGDFNATVLMTYDDGRADPSYELVSDMHDSGVYNNTHTTSVRFKPSQRSDGSGGAHSHADDVGAEQASLERCLFEGVSLSKYKGSLEGPNDEKRINKKRAYAREKRIDRVYKILGLADDITSSSIDAFGEDAGGLVMSLLWNDYEKTGHHNQMTRVSQLLHMPVTNALDVIVAIAGREKCHPLLLPRFEMEFYPEQSGLSPDNVDFVVEGSKTKDADSGKPPRIKCDAGGIPEFKQRVPAALSGLFKEMHVPKAHGQREALYHLLRVAMGDCAFLNLNSLSVSTKLGIPAQTCYGLCAGAYLQGVDSYSRPDITQIVRALGRLSSELGIDEQLAGLIVCASARNVDSLRQLGIVLSTGMKPGQRQQQVDLKLVAKEGLVRGLCGLITGEVFGELLTPCRISADGKRWNTNIDMLCNKLLSKNCDGDMGVFEQNEDLRTHANHLRCVAALGLANPTLMVARRETVLKEEEPHDTKRKGASLFRLVPMDPHSGEDEPDTLKEDKARSYSIIEIFERLIKHPEQKMKKERLYRGFFEGFLQQISSRPNDLNELVHDGHIPLLTKESWLKYVVGDKLWDRTNDAETQSMASNLSVSADDADAKLSKDGSFSFLVFQIIKTFTGNNVPSKKQFGLVPLMEYLRPDGKGFKDVVQKVDKGKDKYVGDHGKRKITVIKKPLHSLPTMEIQPDYAQPIMSVWKLFQQMASNKLGRSANRADVELRSFANIIGACFNDGVATVSPPEWTGSLKKSEIGETKAGTVTETYTNKTDPGSGVQIEVGANGEYMVTHSGTGYTRGAVLAFSVGGKEHKVTIAKTCEFTLTKTAIECMLHIATGNWNSLHGIEPDLVKSQLEVDPPRAVRTNTSRLPEHTPGWKLLRSTDERTIPQLVVGSGRRPLLALRRLRAFIKLGSGAVSREKFEANGTETKSVSLPTEVFALLEGSSVAKSYKIAILGLVFVLDNDVESLSGLWSTAPLLVSSVVQQLLKPSIDTASADSIVKVVRSAAKQELERLKQNNDDDDRLQTQRRRAGSSVQTSGGGGSGVGVGDNEAAASARNKADLKQVTWNMVDVMVDAVKKEFKFHIPNPQDPSSEARRERLACLFDKLKSYAELVDGLGSAKTASKVITDTFSFLEKQGTELLGELLGDTTDDDAEAQTIVHSLFERDDSADGKNKSKSKNIEQFKDILDASVRMLQRKFSAAHPNIMNAVKDVAAAFLDGTIKSSTAIGNRSAAFPPASTVGALLAASGDALQHHAPELAVFAKPPFWINVYVKMYTGPSS